MASEKNDITYWIALFIIVGIGMFYLNTYTNLFSAVVFDDFDDYDDRAVKPYAVGRIGPQDADLHPGIYDSPTPRLHLYEDSLWSIRVRSDAGGTNPEGTFATINGPDPIVLQSNTVFGATGVDAQSTILMTTKQDFRGRDIKMILRYKGGVGQAKGIMDITIGNEVIHRDIADTGWQNMIIEVFASSLDPSIADMFIDGVFFKTVDFTSLNTVPISFFVGDNAVTLEIIRFAYKIPFECQQGPEELLAFESFAGPRSLSITDLRYAPTKFCLAHPAVITDSGASGSTTTAEIYSQLRLGEVLTIPADQTWSVFYIFYNDGSIPLVCDQQAYDVNQNKCIDTTAIVQVCSEGVFEPSLGTCVVNPEVNQICDIGVYDAVQDKCIYHPPVQAICDQGNYNSVTGRCEFTPEETAVCPDGFTYNAIPNKCESFPSAVIVCDPDFSYNSVSGFCEKTVDNVIDCDGTYDNTTGICTKTVIPDIEQVCPEDTNLFQDDQGNYACIYEPGVEASCPQGTFDETMNACVISPDLRFLCLNGELNFDETACVVTPRVRVVCPSNTFFSPELNECIETIGPVSETEKEVIFCPEGTEYDGTNKICIPKKTVDIPLPQETTTNPIFLIGALIALVVGVLLVLNRKKK